MVTSDRRGTQLPLHKMNKLIRTEAQFLAKSALLLALLFTGANYSPAIADSHGNFPGKGSRAKWEQAASLADKAIDLKGPNRTEAGIPLLKKAIEIYPFDGKIYYVLANKYMDKKNYLLAKNNYEKSIQLEPNFADAWYGLGLSLDNQSDLAEGEKAYRQCLKIDPGYASAWYNLGIDLFERGKYPESKQAFKSFLNGHHTEEDSKNISRYLKQIASKTATKPISKGQ